LIDLPSRSSYFLSALPYLIALNQVRGVGPARVAALVAHFGSAEAAWRADAAALAATGLEAQRCEAFIAARARFNLRAAMDKLDTLNVRVLTPDHPDYPALLRTLDTPPPLLYLRGALTAADQHALAVVGTRQATGYGRAVVKRLVGPLAATGLTIVSGLAVGIDTLAHLAVLGCGIDQVYPPENAALAARIAADGALISEYGPGVRAAPHYFPARNRILSGLCYGVLVVEAGPKSGSLITARLAAEQGREVLAVPGDALVSGSQGSNALLRDGARLVTSAQDVLDELAAWFNPSLPTALPRQAKAQAALTATYTAADEEEAVVLAYLAVQDGAPHIDEIAAHAARGVGQISGLLTRLELNGIVEQGAPLCYRLLATER
jgi:DNA processing protein